VGNPFEDVLGHEVAASAVPRETWEALFRAQGANHPLPRIQMIDGFNEEWICFEGDIANRVIGEVELTTVLRGMLG